MMIISIIRQFYKKDSQFTGDGGNELFDYVRQVLRTPVDMKSGSPQLTLPLPKRYINKPSTLCSYCQ